MKLLSLLVFAAVASAGSVAQTPEGARLPVASAMNVDVLVESPVKAAGDLQIVCLFESTPANKLQGSLTDLDTRFGGLLTSIRQQGLFRGTLGETLVITPKAGTIAARRLLVIGLGNRDSFTPELEDLVGEIAYSESERLAVSSPTFAPTILDGGKTGIDTGTIAEAFMRGFERASLLATRLHRSDNGPAPAVRRLTFLAGSAHAIDTQRGLNKAFDPFEAVPAKREPSPHAP